MHPALLYLPGDRLTLAELGSARLDGHVFEVGEGFMPADTVETSAARAASLAAIVPDRAAACGPTAAWVHGAGDLPPTVHHVRRRSIRRFRPSLPPHVVYHDGLTGEGDVRMIAGVGVVDELPTALELLFAAPADPTAERWLRALLPVSEGLVDGARARLEQLSRRPGRRSAMRMLERIAADQDVVTR
ncbi:hypothetical protein [Microbacterium sp.]|uniref:hypothetical protein n=1 Tax=Microbacterium sp. TaxID=51671 RepID=UPI0028127CF3|nr:hypothetical protein [Microbacterium sp.]